MFLAQYATINVIVAHQRRYVLLDSLEHLPIVSVVHESCDEADTVCIGLFLELYALIVCKNVQSRL